MSAPTDVVSSMRQATNLKTNSKEAIIAKRGLFKSLPVAYSNDLEYGSMYVFKFGIALIRSRWFFKTWCCLFCRWFLWGSILTILIPIFPLISFFQELWPNILIIPFIEKIASYCLLVFMGIAYTIGSYLLARAMRVPHLEPLVKWKHLNPDELHGMWWFYWWGFSVADLTE